MKSGTSGKPTSQVEVTHLSRHGFWILLGDRELFLSFEHFPWFHDATVKQITEVTQPHPGHLHWPELDVDLEVDSILHPEKYPLVSRK